MFKLASTISFVIFSSATALADFQPLTTMDIQSNLQAGAGCQYVDQMGITYAYADSQYLLVKTESGVSKLVSGDKYQHVFYGAGGLKITGYFRHSGPAAIETLSVMRWGDGMIDIEDTTSASLSMPYSKYGLKAECGD